MAENLPDGAAAPQKPPEESKKEEENDKESELSETSFVKCDESDLEEEQEPEEHVEE